MFRSLTLMLAAAVCLAAAVKPHPRLIATDADMDRIREYVAHDATAGKLRDSLKQQAERFIGLPPVEHKLIGPRLLDKSRTALDRIYTLALLYRLDGDKRYFDRALKELRAVAAFPDWNPKHFLDTAEMTHAVAIGYDWLYKDLSAEDRELLRKALVEKGLDEGIKVYKTGGWWAKATHNWNQVCNGGMTVGALALQDVEPEKAEYIVGKSKESIKLAMASYGPDGGWNEGPGYWGYATMYNVVYLAALETALDTDFGLSKTPGFPEAGIFRIYFQGPTGSTFNYADAHEGGGRASCMYWLARRFESKVFAWDEARKLEGSSRSRGDALDLVWYQPRTESPAQAHWPLGRVFTGVDVAFLRSDWEDPKAFWVGVKGGDNKANHSHLDMGGFVLEAKGQRWGVDLGSDDYNIGDYFGKLRWTYYRLRTESHNTVLIDGENQDVAGKAKIIGQDFRQGFQQVRIDLTGAYAAKLQKHVRELMLEGKKLTIKDTIDAKKPVTALWGMVTQADIKISGNKVELTRNGEVLRGEIRSPEGAVFETISATPPPPQNQNRGAKKLAVKLPGATAKTVIEVVFE